MNDLNQSTVIDEEYVLNQYKNKIDYYWMASSNNKRSYKLYRSLTILLGTLVILVSSLSAAEFVQQPDWLRIMFEVATPLIAATWTIIIGFGQNFRWGESWRDMVLNATRMERERDRFLSTSSDERDLRKELDIINSMTLDEVKTFFEKVL